MDSLKYWYQYINTAGTVANYDPAAPPTLNNVREFTNKLAYVGDLAPTANYTTDIYNQVVGNYDYDEIGNLTKDVLEKISYIGWTVYGKIDSIEKSTSTAGQVKRISYRYDAMGNRLSKRVVKVGTAIVDYTYYVRDASGTVMSVYNYAQDSTTAATALTAGTLNLIESHLYGSSRLGVLNRLVNVEVNTVNSIIFTRGNKFFELANHLGNVLVTISDRKIQNGAFGGAATFYTADVKTANDYYPFGMNMPGRTFTANASTKFRYGFNGKENDPDVSAGIQDYGMRIYDERLGRFLSVDPITKQYPELTPYQFASNRPIDGIDLDGKEWDVTITKNDDGTTHIHITVKIKIQSSCTTFFKSPDELNKLGDEFNKSLEMAFKNITSKDSKITYSASSSFEVSNTELDRNKDFGILLSEKTDASTIQSGVGISNVKNMSNINVALVYVNKFDKNTGESVQRDLTRISIDMVHEILHFVGLDETGSPGNKAKDVATDRVKLDIPVGNIRFGFIPRKGANFALILKNIMTYNGNVLNGKKVLEQNGGDINATSKVSPDQAKIVTEQIQKDDKEYDSTGKKKK
jgi:RHS repeat-associated protein